MVEGDESDAGESKKRKCRIAYSLGSRELSLEVGVQFILDDNCFFGGGSEGRVLQLLYGFAVAGGRAWGEMGSVVGFRFGPVHVVRIKKARLFELFA